MLRSLALLAFVLALEFVAACGHEITPEPTASDLNLNGKMQVIFRTVGALDTDKYTYAVIVDTCGQGPPYADVYGTSVKGYSYAFLIGGRDATTMPLLEQFVLATGTGNPLNPIALSPNPSLTNVQFFSTAGLTNEFELTFSRRQLDNPLMRAQPCPNITPSPATSASGSASPSPMPTTLAQATWTFNFFVLDDASATVLDSLGPGGATDNSYPGIDVPTGASKTNAFNKIPGSGPIPTDPSAQLEGGEIDNYL